MFFIVAISCTIWIKFTYSAGKNYKANRKIHKSQKVMELFLMLILVFTFFSKKGQGGNDQKGHFS